MRRDDIRVLYILHEDEHEAPAALTEAVDVVMAHAGSIPDFATLDTPPHLIAVGPPVDEEMQHALTKLKLLDLPLVGIGTGSSPHLDTDVSAAISPEDLKTVFELVCEAADLWNLDTASAEHPIAARWLTSVTDSITRMIEHLMSLRIPDYRKRTERVVQACTWIGTHLGLSESDLATLLYSTRLREIGKLGLPDRILFMQRADRSAVDQRLYDRYPALGGQVMTELPTLHEAAQVVECLLENFDGSGPDRLASHQIPLCSRILRVASAYEMILNDSPSCITGDEILAILERGQGSLYDPLIVRLLQNYTAVTDEVRSGHRRTKRIRLADLMEGMVLAEDIWSRSGVKMVPHGTPVNQSILKLLQSGSLDSSLESIEIHCGGMPRNEEDS